MIMERVITVEYLESSMSQQLLCKFPDQSAFDFDYTQSGIWSPLLPRGGHSNSNYLGVPPRELRRKLFHKKKESRQESLGSKIKKKMSIGKKRKAVSPAAPDKGWGKKILKAATKSFKRHKVSPPLRLQNFLNLEEY